MLLPRAVIVLLLFASGAHAQDANVAVSSYTARIEPSFETRSVTGRVTVAFTATRAAPASLTLDAGDLTIDAVRESGAAREFAKHGTKLVIDLPPRADASGDGVEIEYHGTPQRGLSFDLGARAIHTAFATDQWLPSIAAPSERATLDLTLVVPADLGVIAVGRHVGDTALPDDRLESRWLLDRPMPAYLFGFAAGRFTRVQERARDVDLVYAAPGSWSEQQLREVFAATADMLDFYSAKAGVAYPDRSYAQVMLPGASGQELAGLAVIGERYGKAVLEDRTAIWLGAHELAHQWWGNSVTNESWSHFWLNEGIGTFMTAAYLEHRFGRDEYLRQIHAAEARYRVVDGGDRPLVFADWTKPTAADRSIVYDKGAYVVHRLREELGDDAFWRGLSLYTRRHWGGAVTTRDFEAAMEEASGRDLTAFFATWVYGRTVEHSLDR